MCNETTLAFCTNSLTLEAFSSWSVYVQSWLKTEVMSNKNVESLQWWVQWQVDISWVQLQQLISSAAQQLQQLDGNNIRPATVALVQHRVEGPHYRCIRITWMQRWDVLDVLNWRRSRSPGIPHLVNHRPDVRSVRRAKHVCARMKDNTGLNLLYTDSKQKTTEVQPMLKKKLDRKYIKNIYGTIFGRWTMHGTSVGVWSMRPVKEHRPRDQYKKMYFGTVQFKRMGHEPTSLGIWFMGPVKEDEPVQPCFCMLYWQVIDDWRYVAQVIDRLLFYIYMVVTVATTLAILINAPHVFQSVEQEAIKKQYQALHANITIGTNLVMYDCHYSDWHIVSLTGFKSLGYLGCHLTAWWVRL